ncbi:DoxX family membrane protein [Gillisia sp. CAL575]|uniref:DoxX family membrane protein n=1 Tax=Gillisia sp. CAL575 TaxID=985255 RepID=UPI0003A483E5|nr:DoxX family membrane protein [Gillisia sp. CAL575]
MENITNYITEILILIFIAITFLQSGFDKITDWQGNIGWLKGHFSKTFLAGQVPLMVGIILIIEVIAGLMALVGIFYIISSGQTEIALYANVLAAITLLMLLFGQRVAKDYAGAFTIVGYFIVVILGVTLLS